MKFDGIHKNHMYCVIVFGLRRRIDVHFIGDNEVNE